MIDVHDNDAAASDPPDADAVYARYLESCRRLGVDPVARERAGELIAEWSAAIERGVHDFTRGHDYKLGHADSRVRQ